MDRSAPSDFASLLRSIKEDYEKQDLEEVRSRCRGFFSGKIFVSHTAADAEFCKRIIIPLLESYGVWGHFFLSIADGLAIASAYRHMVEYSLYYCKTILIILSARSVNSQWCRLEANWAADQKHPIIVCRLDNTEVGLLHPGLRKGLFSQRISFVDFSGDEGEGQARLRRLLQKPRYAPVLTWRDLSASNTT